MGKSTSGVKLFMPAEYRKAAERMFPAKGFLRGYKPDLKTTAEFAKVLGVGNEYQRVIALEKDAEETKEFLHQFRNNLDLLIQKTWVEKHEERLKGKLQNDIPVFMEKIDKSDFFGAIESFSTILKELAYLFFGSQSTQEDFAEYAFRIDNQMGLFWWYGANLSFLNEYLKKLNKKDDKFLRAVLLIGICYLTNF